jgi:capsid protein
MSKSPILDSSGNAIERVNVREREREVRQVLGTYDAARTTSEFENYWANADRFDADSANNKNVRHTLISRSRYEATNNGYTDGIVQTYATDLIGVGPKLRMQTASQAFNQLIERTWELWSRTVQFRRKLWCMAHAKCVDGETFAVMRRNRKMNFPVKLDIRLYEAEQCQTPFVPFDEPGYIDGIKFDEFGNPLWYDILREHPGAGTNLNLDMTPERVPASRVLHWFKLRRPDQHRGVAEMASTLTLGAAARRMREATLAAAETAADINVMMTTQLTPDTASDPAAPFSTIPIQKRMLTMAPMGWDATHFKSEHPATSYDGFNKSNISEQARPKNMPRNKAMCDSSDYNYSSGRLDHGTYYDALDVDREDCNDVVLIPLFTTWFEQAVVAFGWLRGQPENITAVSNLHLWDWPKHRVADVETEANANRTRLESGQISLPRLKADSGIDAEDDAQAEADYYGITIEELKRRQLDAIYPPPKQAKPNPATQEAAAAGRMNGFLAANGVHHG